MRPRDNSGPASSTYTDSMSVEGYNSLRLEFDYFVSSFEKQEDFFVEWSTANGSTWTVEARWIRGSNLVKDQWIRESVPFDQWVSAGRPSNIAICIRSDASSNTDMLY